MVVRRPTRPDQGEEWLTSVYSDTVLNVLWDDDRPS
jgi:hypothetical protein